MDILLFYFGWALRIPFVPRLFFSLPGSPRLVSFLATRLPKRPVRGQCCDVTCLSDGEFSGFFFLSKPMSDAQLTACASFGAFLNDKATTEILGTSW